MVDTPDPAGPAERPDGSGATDPQVALLLEEISQLRLSAATHLTVAAAAMDLGRPDIASELIEAQQRDVAQLRERAEQLLRIRGRHGGPSDRQVLGDATPELEADASGWVAARRSARVHHLDRDPSRGRGSGAAVFLPHRRSADRARPRGGRALGRRACDDSAAPRWTGAGALLALSLTILMGLTGPLRTATPPDGSVLDASLAASLDSRVVHSYDQLRVTAKPTAASEKVDIARARLHADLQRVLPAAAHDADAARRVIAVLAAERVLLSRERPAALAAFEADAGSLVSRLRLLASPAVQAILPGARTAADHPGTVGGAVTSQLAVPAAPTPVAPDAAVPPAAGDSSGVAVTPEVPLPVAPPVITPVDPAPASPVVPQPGAPDPTDPPAAGGTTDPGNVVAPGVTAPGLPQLPAPPVPAPATG